MQILHTSFILFLLVSLNIFFLFFLFLIFIVKLFSFLSKHFSHVISKIDQVDPVTLKDSSAALTKKISELALAITNIILNLGLGRLINMDKKTRALFMQLQHIVKKASDTGRNSSVIEMGRSLLTVQSELSSLNCIDLQV